MRRLLLLVGTLAACAPARPPAPALFSPQLASDRSLVTGAVIGMWPDSAGSYFVVLDKAGRAYRVLLPAPTGRYTRAGMTMVPGKTVTAWCRGVGTDLTADSVRVEPGP